MTLRAVPQTLLSLTTALVLVIALCGCSGKNAEATGAGEADVKEDIGFVMGTAAMLTIYTEDDTIIPDIIELLTQMESERISREAEGSEISRLNAQAGGTVVVSDEFAGYLETALSLAEGSSGAFDPTIGQLTELWGFDEGRDTVPPDAEIQALREGIGYGRVSLEGTTVSMPAGMLLDLGAIGKGLGCDEVEAFLAGRSSVTGAIVNLGDSSILTFGEKGNGEDWNVAIANPAVSDPAAPAPESDDFLGVLALTGTNHLSTSGDYEQYFEVDGKRYHHILDPVTGYPAKSGLRSVTVVSGSGALSDALSTACFVLGAERGWELVRDYGAEAVFVDDENKVYVTAGLWDRFKLLADDYTLEASPLSGHGGT
jgi:thiamine biosynthesis lipoprotein